MGFVRYEHSGQDMAVRDGMANKHREHCLCYDCPRFIPGVEDVDNVSIYQQLSKSLVVPIGHNGCNIARLLFMLRKRFGIIIPVWGCSHFPKAKCK